MKSPIEKIIPILRKEVHHFEEPSITRIARESSRTRKKEGGVVIKRDPFQVLISCILSLRTKDQVTTTASARLFTLANTPEKMLRLTEKQIQKAIYPVAFYRVKAKNIKKVCKLVLNGIPSTMEELLKLPNVGRKTANIVLVHGFKKYGIPVDTHVHRISNRLGMVTTKTPDQTEFALREKLPKRFWLEYNDLLVTWGQNICAPISPWCSRCVIFRYCKRVGVGRSR